MNRILDPVDRVSEVIFGLLMALSFTGTINAATDGREEVRTLLLAALACNLAWGLADAVMYLMRAFTERTRNRALHAAVHQGDGAIGRAAVADTMPEGLAKAAGEEVLEALRQRVRASPATALRARLDWHDFLSAFVIFCLVALTTFPVVIPFMVIDQLPLAMRTSNAVALVLLFISGWALARHSGGKPWHFAIALTVFGAALTLAIIALGG